MAEFQTKIIKFISSRQFFRAVLLLFFIESAWIAVSAAYPMVFDENVHFTLIQAYAHQWSPLWAAHSTATDPAGAVVRDPSYLYHYLMSFPYRLISAFTSSQMIQVIALRFIDIFLFGGSLILFRRLMLKTKVSPAIVHICILLFVLTPVVPLLAGQINYDNLIMPITAGALLVATSVSDRLLKGQLPIKIALWLLTLCLLGSLVQFEFLPIFAAIVAWLAWRFWQVSHDGNIKIVYGLSKIWHATSLKQKLLITVPLIIAIGLFMQMYGVNLVKYHTMTPACNQVLTDKQCLGSASWVRAQNALEHKTAVNTDPAVYAASWTYRMFVAMFFTNSGGASSKAFYLSVNPLPLIFGAAIVGFGAGVVLLLKYRQSVLMEYRYLGFLFFVSLFYTFILLLHNYLNFVQLGQKFAIQGRYIFPVALPLMFIMALAVRHALGNRERLKGILLLVVLVLFLQGGGTLTYITDSNQNWYWHNSAVDKLNKLAQDFVKPLIIVKTPLHNFGRLE
jgi:hypothetical protein